MWHTSQGDRTLRGAEATLVRAAIESMVDSLLIFLDEIDQLDHDATDAQPDCGCGIAVYDGLTVPQRIAVLHDVAKYLLTETDHVLTLSAELEAAVAAIFIEIRDQVAIEINFPAIDEDPHRWRSLVRNAYQNVRDQEGPGGFGEGFDKDLDEDFDEELPAVDDGQMERWDLVIESLTDGILWDRDFEMADSFLDGDPDAAQQRRRLLGIDDEYFTSIAPDPRPEEVDQLVSRTRRIVRAKPR